MSQNVLSKKLKKNSMEQMGRDLRDQAARLNTWEEYIEGNSDAMCSSSSWINASELNVRDYQY